MLQRKMNKMTIWALRSLTIFMNWLIFIRISKNFPVLKNFCKRKRLKVNKMMVKLLGMMVKISSLHKEELAQPLLCPNIPRSKLNKSRRLTRRRRMLLRTLDSLWLDRSKKPEKSSSYKTLARSCQRYLKTLREISWERWSVII